MIYASVCSGIEAPTVAWESLGWKAAWFSEIEPFPCAVLQHHYPETPNLGDMTKTHERTEFNDTDIDVLIGGTPCQSFSVAGLRKGLADPRGNLALAFLGIVDRKRPAWVVWENVPVSCRRAEGGILEPSSGGWLNSGMGSPTEYWTLKTSESHSVAVASSLSHILETGDLPQRYFLSAIACQGILRRAERRGKTLPPALKDALQAVANARTSPIT